MSIVNYLEEIIDDHIKPTQKGDEVHFNCPVCGEIRHRMYCNLSTHVVYCHNCGYTDTFINFIRQMEGVSYTVAVQRYTDVKGSAYIPEDIMTDLRKNLFIGDIKHDMELRPIKLPKEYIPLDFDSKNPVMKSAIKYLRKRRITIRQMKTHNFGLCMSGEYHNRIIIPVNEFGEPRFFVARAIGENVKGLKEKSPSTEDYQISKSQVIFNIDMASAIGGYCVLSEGIFDALSFDEVGTSLLGKRMSDDQLALLLDYRDYLKNGVYIALDWDAKKDALKLAHQLYEYFPVHLINMPKDDLPKGHDPNSYLRKYGRKAMFDLIDNAEEYDFSYHLKQKFFI